MSKVELSELSQAQREALVEQIKAESKSLADERFAALQAEREKRRKIIDRRIGEKGGMSHYGLLQAWPVTLYYDQWQVLRTFRIR